MGILMDAFNNPNEVLLDFDPDMGNTPNLKEENDEDNLYQAVGA